MKFQRRNVTGSAMFDAFGQRTVTGAAERYGFTGREHDAESGLIYFRARHYDPALGQFLQRDPIGFAAGDLNLYSYVWNDPFNWTDPSGLAGTECLAGPACQPQGAGAAVKSKTGRSRRRREGCLFGWQMDLREHRRDTDVIPT